MSIGLPVYNGENYLEEALRSLQAQTFQDLEIVIADNASTDRTSEICTELATRDPRIRYVRNDRNVGAGRNFNIVFDHAVGEYFKWAAHDDLVEPDFVRKCVEALDAYPTAVIAYSRTIQIDETGRHVKRYERSVEITSPRPSERFHNVVWGPPSWWIPIFGLMRADVLRAVQPFGSWPGADHVLLAEMSLYGPFVRVPEDLFLHRQHADRYVRRRLVNASSIEQTLSWWDPARPNAVDSRWREISGYLTAVRRSPVLAQDRLRCYSDVLTWTAKHWREIGADFLRTTRGTVVHRLRRNGRGEGVSHAMRRT